MPAKLVITKSTKKRHQSTRSISRKLKSKGYSIPYSTVYRYLRNTLNTKPYKRQRQPKLTEKQRENRLKFCKARQNWTTEEWKRVIFSDECPFELIHAPNRQNDRIWAPDKSNVPPIELVKHPPKIQVWGMISYQAVTDLHMIDPGQTVTADYYVNEVLKKTLSATYKRKRKTGSTIQRKMVHNMSNSIFQQDGAPAHHSKKSQEWLKNNIPSFWEKGIWPGNSPDLNPIENVWAIMKSDMDTMTLPHNLKKLENNIKLAWSRLSPDMLENLYNGMPNRVNKCIKQHGGYISK